MKTKYIFVTGGVVSSLGKGIIAASLGKLLTARGFSVTIQKLDPYLNIDPGTMSPFQHGEVFVTADGAETDLDLGHYERFINRNLTKASSVSAGKIYQNVLERERKGEFLGATVQIIPHITNEIKRHIFAAGGDGSNFVIVEIGGTIGDIEGLPFIEAIRQIRLEAGQQNALFLHATLIPFIPTTGELKTKPTQHSVQELRSLGIQPDILVCRSQGHISKPEREKIGLFTNVPAEAVISCIDQPSIYQVPLALEEEGLVTQVLQRVGVSQAIEPDLTQWRIVAHKSQQSLPTVHIGIAGKYTKLSDAYLSVVEALKHAGIYTDCSIQIQWISAEECTTPEAATTALQGLDGLLVPGGFGIRGIEGKINLITAARTQCIPFFGICLGMQCAVIEYARNVCNIMRANSAEFMAPDDVAVIDLMAEQKEKIGLGGTMRLGSFPCKINSTSKAYTGYQKELVQERHRHRYEVSDIIRPILEKNGMRISGTSPDTTLVEIIEVPDHPWFIGVQFHPELQSRPESPHPLFMNFVTATIEEKNKKCCPDTNTKTKTYKPYINA